MSELDKEFDAALLAQLNDKLAEAAKVMHEVNELRSKLGLDSLILTQWRREELYSEIKSKIEEEENRRVDSREIYNRMEDYQSFYDQIKTDGLEREMNRAGWSTSSSYC